MLWRRGIVALIAALCCLALAPGADAAGRAVPVDAARTAALIAPPVAGDALVGLAPMRLEVAARPEPLARAARLVLALIAVHLGASSVLSRSKRRTSVGLFESANRTRMGVPFTWRGPPVLV